MSDRLDDKLDFLSNAMQQNHVENVQRLARIETQLEQLAPLPVRVQALENARGYITGVAAAVTAIFSAVITLVVDFLFRKIGSH
jgi:hypothetical protein